MQKKPHFIMLKDWVGRFYFIPVGYRLADCSGYRFYSISQKRRNTV